MKKQLHIFTFLLLLVSCASNDDEVNVIQDESVSRMYEQGKEYVKASVQNTYFNLTGVRTRGGEEVTPSAFLNYILNMPQSQVDSLKALYCQPNQIEAIEAMRDAREDALIEKTSYEDVAKLHTFINDYVSVGGNSIRLLEKATKGTDPLIQFGMAVAAASVDEMLEGYPITRVDFGCLEEVLKQNGYSISEDVLLELADMGIIATVPETSVEDIMYGAGVAVSEITLLTIQYEDCRAGRWH